MPGRILHHTERKVPKSESAGDPLLMEAVGAHVERHIGPIEWVIEEVSSDVIRLDLLWVQPDPRRNFHTFVTCGMAERAMYPPSWWKGCRHAELLLRLPAHWKLGPTALGDARYQWPLWELEHLARLPHLHETFLWAGHTVANAGPPEPLGPSTRFTGSVLTVASWIPPEFDSLPVDPRRRVHFFSVIPLYTEELRFARRRGTQALLKRMKKAGVTDLLGLRRPTVVDPTAHRSRKAPR